MHRRFMRQFQLLERYASASFCTHLRFGTKSHNEGPQEPALLRFEGEKQTNWWKEEDCHQPQSNVRQIQFKSGFEKSFYLLNLLARRKFNSLMKIAVVLGLLLTLHGQKYCAQTAAWRAMCRCARCSYYSRYDHNCCCNHLDSTTL